MTQPNCGVRVDGGPCALPYGHVHPEHKAYIDILIDALPDPDMIGQSEYRAMHGVIVDGLGSALTSGMDDPKEMYDLAVGMLSAFEENVMMLRETWLGLP